MNRLTFGTLARKYVTLTHLLLYIQIVMPCLFLTLSTLHAQTNSPITVSFFTEDFWQKVTIAIISAILALVSSYLIFRANERSKPRAQLSYNIDMDRALSPFKQALEKDTQVLFRGSDVQNLFQIKCLVRNTGNTIVRQEEIRFSFGDTAKILDFSPPEPEAEIGLSTDGSLNRHQTDRRISVNFFPRQREMNFDFVVDGERPRLNLYAKNDKDDVDFVPGALRQRRYDEDILKRFFIVMLFFLILPDTFGFLIPIVDLSGMVKAFAQIVLLVFLLPLLPRASQIIAHRILQMRNEGYRLNANRGAIVIGRDMHGSTIEMKSEADRDTRLPALGVGRDVHGSRIEMKSEADLEERLAPSGDTIG